MPTQKRPVKAGCFFCFSPSFPFPLPVPVLSPARAGGRGLICQALDCRVRGKCRRQAQLCGLSDFGGGGAGAALFAVRPAHLWRCARPAGEPQKGGGCWKSEGDMASPSVGALSGEKSAVLPGQGLLPFLIGPGPLWLDFGFCLDHRSSRIGPHSPSQVWALFDRASFSHLNFGPFWLRSLFSGRTSYSPVGLFPPRSNLLPLRLNARFPSWRDLLFQLSFAHLGWDPSPLARLRPLSGLSPSPV